MDIVPFIQSGVLDGCKLTNRHFLKNVKSMDYDEFCDAIACVIPDLSMTLPLFHSDEWYEFVTFTYDGKAPSEMQISEEEYVVRDGKKEYPITLIQTGQQQWRLEGMAPHCLAMLSSHTHAQHHQHQHQHQHRCVMNLPLVIESIASSKEDTYHQTVLVIDFCKQDNKNIAFLYDPNGESSRFNSPIVNQLVNAYVNLINVERSETAQIQFDRLSNKRINLYLNHVGGGNCVVCCILFMISYSLLGLDVAQFDDILQASKNLVTKLHILLYNAIGFELQRFVRVED